MESTPSNGKTVQEWKVIRLSRNILPFNIQSSVLTAHMFVIPVSFGKEHKNMLAHTKEHLENQNEEVAIHPRFNKLITSLMTGVEKVDGA